MAADLVQIVSSLPDVNGRYDAHAPIGGTGGGGHFSTVFKANDRSRKRQVALKFFLDRGDPYRRACFDREGELLSTLLKGEPLFVQLSDAPDKMIVQVQTTSGLTFPIEFPFLPFEWLGGGDLEGIKGPPTDSRELLRRLALFRSACRCVRRLHHLGCCHRDLKPANFFLGPFPDVKLGDFGTARPVDPKAHSLRSSYQFFTPGDLRYAAPEVYAGIEMQGPFLLAADMFSLGAMLFEFLTGHLLTAYQFQPLGALPFASVMKTIPDAKRLAMLNNFFDTQGNKIPNLRTINPLLPKCAYPRLEDLLLACAHFDYRKRETSFARVDRLVEMAEIVVRNEASYVRNRGRKYFFPRASGHV